MHGLEPYSEVGKGYPYRKVLFRVNTHNFVILNVNREINLILFIFNMYYLIILLDKLTIQFFMIMT